MPELPEVETVRRGLAPVFEGARVRRIETRRPDLRFPFPEAFVNRLEGATVVTMGRRGKYLLAALSSGETLIMHLGMTGRFTVDSNPISDARLAAFYFAAPPDPRHDHVIFELETPSGMIRATYNDVRRFGFMDLASTSSLAASAHFAGMGPEPLSDDFTDAAFNAALIGRRTPIKAALLDQSVVAGVGNIYACEALWRARISPRREAASVAGKRAARLRLAVCEVLSEAIEAGGSTLRDFAASDGALGYFQHRFNAYDRAGEPCAACGAPLKRIVQSGRSTFYCGTCQR